MARAEIVNEYDCSPIYALQVAEHVGRTRGMAPEAQETAYLKLKTQRAYLLRMQDKGVIDVRVSRAGERTRCEWSCQNFGIGPLNGRVVRKNLERFTTEFERALRANPEQPAITMPEAMPGGGSSAMRRSGGGTTQ